MNYNGNNNLIENFMQDSCKEIRERWAKGLPSLAYHKSWDFLMPVVDKIEKIINVAEVSIRRDGCVIRNKSNHKDKFSVYGKCFAASTDKTSVTFLNKECYLKATKILCVHKCVVEFIKWYNKQAKDR